MSCYIDLDCGCRINEAFVIHMCVAHAVDLRRKKLDDEKDYARFRERMEHPPQPGNTDG